MTSDSRADPGGQSIYEAIQASPEFVHLRKAFRRFVVPAAVVFLAWYFLYVLLAAYATDFMAVKVAGAVNIGLVMGLLQFASTFTITILYARWAHSRLDPLAAELRDRIEGGEFE